MCSEEGGAEFLKFRGEGYDSARPSKPKDESLESLADLMDFSAESCNAHEFVCTHRGLAVILFQEVGRKRATAIMRRIANYEGLYGLVGVSGKGDLEQAEEELGVSLHDTSDWSLPDGK